MDRNRYYYKLLRRIIRDYRFRGYSAEDTINRWPSVRRGEDKWIFPYQENADAMFNSAMLYELAALRKFAKDGWYLTESVFAAKFTDASSTPGSPFTVFSTLLAHTAQLISRTGSIIVSKSFIDRITCLVIYK